jgi:hypothetical protein
MLTRLFQEFDPMTEAVSRLLDVQLVCGELSDYWESEGSR